MRKPLEGELGTPQTEATKTKTVEIDHGEIALKLPVLLLVILTTALLAGGGAVAAAYFFLLPTQGEEKTEEAEAPRPVPPAQYFELSKALLITLDSRGGPKYLQLSFSVMARHEETLKALAAGEPRLRNDLIIKLGAEDPEALRTPEGREALRQIILETAQERIEPFQDPETGEAFGVEDVLLTNLVMQ